MKRFRQVFITAMIFLLLFSAMAYGDTWTKNKRLTWNAGESAVSAIAVDGSNIYVLWCDNTPGNYEIYFKKSDDGGVTWTKSKRLTWNAGDSWYPATAVDGQNIYVVWYDNTPGNYQIYFKKSDDGGTTWTKSKRLTWNAGDSYGAKIAVDGSNIGVVWSNNTPGNYEIYFKRSDDGGTTWTPNKRLTNNAGTSAGTDIAVDGSNIYVVRQDNTPGNLEIYFKKSDDGGTTWTTNKRLTWSDSSSAVPAIAVDGSNIYVVWQDTESGNDVIYFKKSDDGGVTWTANKRLTNTAGGSYDPAIAVDGPNIYVAWDDDTPGNYEIYFKKSDDGGTTWTTSKRLTWNAGDSYVPKIAVDGPNIYVVWEDNTPGNYEIYFKKGVLF